MSHYSKVEVKLTEAQQKIIDTALRGGTSAMLRFNKAQLQDQVGGKHMLLTTTQFNKLQKAISAGKGCTLTLSVAQLKSMQSGGFIVPLLAGLASALAPTIFNRLFPPKEPQHAEGIAAENGSGINLPGSGINLPGTGEGAGGWIDPLGRLIAKNAAIAANNDRTLRGQPAVAYPELAGNGLILGDNGQARLGPTRVGGAVAYIPAAEVKKKPARRSQPMMGAGAPDMYLSPSSERFQMLQ
jgi:hypothetical protein